MKVQHTTLDELSVLLDRAAHLSDVIGESSTADATALLLVMRCLLYNQDARYRVTFEASLAGNHIFCAIWNASVDQFVASCTAKGEWPALRGAIEQMLHDEGVTG